MNKFKKLIADDIEIKCPMGHSSDGTFYKDTSWIDGANQYASLLEKALDKVKGDGNKHPLNNAHAIVRAALKESKERLSE